MFTKQIYHISIGYYPIYKYQKNTNSSQPAVKNEEKQYTFLTWYSVFITI